MDSSTFHVIAQKGFQIFYANGWGISVMFGYDNYCDNRNNRSLCPWNETSDAFEFNKCNYFTRMSSATAEVAVLNPKGEYVNGVHWPHGNQPHQVAGHLTPDQVNDVMVWVQQQPAE